MGLGTTRARAGDRGPVVHRSAGRGRRAGGWPRCPGDTGSCHHAGPMPRCAQSPALTTTT